MKAYLQLTFILLLFLTVVPSNADAITGNRLLEQCLNGENKTSPTYANTEGFCRGYIIGTVESSEGEIGCLPSSVTRNQLVLVVKKSLKENPQQLHNHAVGLILNALIKSFPCKKTEPETK